MLDNFQFSAVVKQGRRTRLLRVPLHQGLQDSLAQSWQAQYGFFTDHVQEIEFDAGYIPEQHERFCLRNYQLPDWLRGEDSQSIPHLDSVTNDDSALDAAKAVVAFARNEQGDEMILFQNFSRSHVIRPGFFLFLRADTYETTHRPGLTLGDKLGAIFLPNEGKLLFQNFRTVNTFLPLSDFYEEAPEQQIREVLAHHRLET